MPALAVATSVAGERRRVPARLRRRTRASGSRRSRSRSRRRSPCSCSTSTRAPGSGPTDVRVRHLLAHVDRLRRRDRRPRALRRGRRRARRRRSPSCRRSSGSSPLEAAWSYANTGYWLAGWLAARQNGSTYEEALAGARARPGRPRRGDVRRAEPRGHRRRARAAATIRAPAGRRAGSSRPRRDVGRFADWQLRQPWTNALRVPPRAGRRAASTGSASSASASAEIDVWGHPGSYGGFQSLAPARAEPRRVARRR